MSVYTDMACDAGYPFGTEENKQMASMIEEHERQAYEDKQMEEYRETLFRKLIYLTLVYN